MSMIKISGFLLLVLFLLLPAAGAWADDVEGARLTFNEERIDFGEVDSDTLLTHVFTFENTGNDTLEIMRVRSS